MQSLTVSNENNQRLEALRKKHEDAFACRDTFIAVQELLERCRFRLMDRRAIINLFALEVRLLNPAKEAINKPNQAAQVTE